MLNRFTLIRPSRLIPTIIGGQCLLWIVFFPEVPKIDNAEPKCHDLGAYLMFGALFTVLMVGVMIGEGLRVEQADLSQHQREANASRLFNLGRWVFWPMVFSLAVQFRLFLQSPERMTQALVEASGLNSATAEMRTNTISGIASFSTLLMVTVVCMALAEQSSLLEPRKRRTARRYLVCSGVMILFMSTFGAARQFLLLYFAVLLCAWAIGRKRISRPRVALILLAGIAVFWAQTLSRQGTFIAQRDQMPLLSWHVQERICAELVEGYLPGEFNRTLIVFSYPADPGRNFLYGTAFDRFHLGYSPEGRNLNTFNALGIWYWQLGTASLFLAFGFGFWIGRIYRKAIQHGFQLDVPTCTLLLALAGVYTMVRDNFLFLQFYLVPLLFLFFCNALWLGKSAKNPTLGAGLSIVRVKNLALPSGSYLPDSEPIR